MQNESLETKTIFGKIKPRVRSMIAGGLVGVALTSGCAAMGRKIMFGNAVETTYTNAVDQYKAKNYEEAIKLSNAIIQLDPEYWKAWTLIGNCNYDEGNLDQAIGAYERAAELNPTDTRLQGWLQKMRAQKH